MDFLRVSQQNVSACQSHQGAAEINQINQVLFWTAAVVSILISIFGVIANCLVIYFANQEPSTGALRHLNQVVKHLAVADMLYGVLVSPCSLAYWKIGKLELSHRKNTSSPVLQLSGTPLFLLQFSYGSGGSGSRGPSLHRLS